MITLDYIATIISLISLLIAWRAYSLSKERLTLQKETHYLQKNDLEAKQKPKIQVTSETFLNSWQRGIPHEDCKLEDLDVEYSAIYENKGESTIRIDGVSIHVCPTESPTGNAKQGLACFVFGPAYLSPGDAVSINQAITPREINITRIFFDNFKGVLAFVLKIRYVDHLARMFHPFLNLAGDMAKLGWFALTGNQTSIKP